MKDIHEYLKRPRRAPLRSEVIMVFVVATIVVALVFGVVVSWAFRRFHEVAWFLALLPMLLMAGVAAGVAGEYRDSTIGVLGISAGVAAFCLWAGTISALVGRVVELERRLGALDGTAKNKDVPPPAWSL